MDISDASRRILLATGLCVFVFLLSRWIFVSDYVEEQGSINSTIETHEKDLKPFYTLGGQRISIVQSQLDKQIQERKNDLEAMLSDAQVKIPKHLLLPASENQPDFFFKQQLTSIREKLSKKASVRNTDLPYDLGFGEELPKPEEVPDMLHRLTAVEILANAMIDAGMGKVMSIELPKTTTIGPTQDTAFIEAIPIGIIAQCTIHNLTTFLKTMHEKAPWIFCRAMTNTADYDRKNRFRLEVSIELFILKGISDLPTAEEKKKKSSKKERKHIDAPLGV